MPSFIVSLLYHNYAGIWASRLCCYHCYTWHPDFQKLEISTWWCKKQQTFTCLTWLLSCRASSLAKRLYGSHILAEKETKPPHERKPASEQDLQRALECGRFGDTKPSELFLRTYHDILLSIQHDPLARVTSPSLIGSTGVVPMTVIGPLIDNARRMSNLMDNRADETQVTSLSMQSNHSRSTHTRPHKLCEYHRWTFTY